jgi:putative membrane protein
MTPFFKLTAKTVICLLGLTLATSCSNNNHAGEKDSKEQAKDMNEEKFDREGEKAADRLVEAYSENLYEIKASENAAMKASTADVKKLAGMMVESHTKMNTNIERLAQTKNVTLPTDLSDEQRRKMEKLSEKTGLDYDKEYCDEMKNKHEDAIKSYEKIADKCDDPEIKQWASETLPEIRTHRDMVEATRNNIKDLKNTSLKDKLKGDDTHDGKDNNPRAH